MLDKKRIYISKNNEWNKYILKDYKSNRKLAIEEIKNGIILPARYYGKPAGSYEGGVCSADFKYIAGVERDSRTSKAFPRYYGMGKSYEVDGQEIVCSDENVIFGGGLIGHFGHFMLESLPGRLWYILEHPEDKRKVAFVMIIQQCEWFYQFFELLGIEKDRIIMINEPTQFANITVPEECVHSWYNFTDEYKEVYCKIVQKANELCDGKKIYPKIYLGHRKWNRGSECVGEENFEVFFEHIGYKVIEPQDYTVSEQIYMISNADEIVTTMGSLAHFELFAKDNAKFIMLTREYKSCIVAQCLVNQARGIDWYIVNANNNFLPANRTYGPVNMAFTDDFKEFCANELNINCDDILRDLPIKSFTDDYIKSWVEYYSIENNYKKICNMSVFDILNRMSYELLDKKLEKPQFEGKNDINKLRHDIGKMALNMCAVQNMIVEQNQMLRNIDSIVSYPICDIHVSNKGWIQNYNFSEIYAGHQIEAIRIENSKITIEVSVYSEKYGWMTSKDGCTIGTMGKGIPIQKIKMRCVSEEARIYYRVAANGKWQEWNCDGDESEVFEKIEGIQVYLMRKNNTGEKQ